MIQDQTRRFIGRHVDNLAGNLRRSVTAPRNEQFDFGH
jgi:hypothetical protein